MQNVTNTINRSMLSTRHNSNFDDNDEVNFNNITNEINASEIIEWKKDIETSLEKISERVALNDCSAYLNLIEKKVNEIEEDLYDIKKLTKEFPDINDTIKKNSEKCDKCEILCDEFINQISDLKSTNLNWQTQYNQINSDLTDKIFSHEFYIDQLQKFEKNITKKFEGLNSEIKKKENNDSEINEKSFVQKFSKIEEVKTIFNIFNLKKIIFQIIV